MNRADREAHEQLVKQAKPVPPRRLTDPAFEYVPSNKTDIRETFKRVLAERRGAKR